MAFIMVLHEKHEPQVPDGCICAFWIAAWTRLPGAANRGATLRKLQVPRNAHQLCVSHLRCCAPVFRRTRWCTGCCL